MTDVHRLPTALAADNREARGLWPTSIAEGIRNIIKTCHLGRQIGVITGPSGIGKTTAAMAAVAEIREGFEEAYYVRLTAAAAGLQPGLIRIAREIGGDAERHMGASDIHDLIVRRWWDRDALLVVDEAQYASDALLQGIRDMWDDLTRRNGNPSVVLLGTSELSDRIKGSGRRKDREFAPLRGRLGAMVELDGLSGEDFAAIARHVGIAGAQAAKVVETAGRGRGGLHNVARLVAQARQSAGPGAIGLSDLRRAAEMMGVA